ncbi:MgtC/SapB family protein [Deinococcus pimensis]|uniref:MgtC/SapB family protein n=1 Tax=Deinococcus pimensis TaxID=309888 RepID=UPI001FE0C8F8|nr:MgtC/SapB family protein [Deinococcus pimensis]
MTDLFLLLRLVVAVVLSGLIGWERELRGRGAGLRTQMLVGGSAALFVILAEALVLGFAGDAPGIRFDVVGVLGAVVSGVAFLGAGAIFSSERRQRRGLTTAASMLATAAVGVACGLTHYVLAAGATAIFLVVLRVLGRLKAEVLADDEED